MATDGRGWKSIRVGDKNHVAWCFPVLETTQGNDPVHLVDCFDLPVDDDFNMSVDDDSFSQESLSSEDIVTGERSDDVNKLALDPSTGLFFENQEYDEENPLLVLENVCDLTLMPEGDSSESAQLSSVPFSWY